MKSVFWTSVFWIVVVAGLCAYTKWFNTQWAQAVSEFVYEQDVGTGETALDDESIAGQLILLNTKIDMLLSGSTQMPIPTAPVAPSMPGTNSMTTPPTQEEMTIRDLESRIKELESKLNAAQ